MRNWRTTKIWRQVHLDAEDWTSDGWTSSDSQDVNQFPVRLEVELIGAQRRERWFLDEMMILSKTEQSEDDSEKTYYIKSRDQKENEFNTLILVIVDHKETIENYKDQLSLTDVRIKTARKSISQLDVSKANTTDIWHK